MGDAARKDEEADRIERLISAQEAQTNMLGRLLQLLERQAQRRAAVKAGKVRREPTRSTAALDPRTERIVQQALARTRARE
jgi:hypothetical protein